MKLHFPARLGRQHALLLLGCLTALQLLAAIYFYHRLRTTGYLPSPFVYDKTDTFMDLYNTMYWAGMPGRYSIWGSVYPPLAFLVLDALRALFVPTFPFSGPHALRAGSPSLQIALCAAYLLLPALALSLRAWRDFRRSERVLMYFAAITSLPFLFALERGNLILLAPPLLVLLADDRPALRIVALALLINLKPYFAVLFLAYAARQWWDELVMAVMVTGLLYLGTSVLIGANPVSMMLNLVHFGQSASVFSLREVLSFPSSVSAFSTVLANPRFLASKYAHIALDPTALAALINAAKWTIIAITLLGIFRRGRDLPIIAIFAILIVVTTNLGTSVGGYSLIFYLAIIPAMLRMRFRTWYLLLLAAIFVPLDPFATIVSNDIGRQVAYLSGQNVDVTWRLGLATAMRPLLNLALTALMGAELNWRDTRVAARSDNSSSLKQDRMDPHGTNLVA